MSTNIKSLKPLPLFETQIESKSYPSQPEIDLPSTACAAAVSPLIEQAQPSTEVRPIAVTQKTDLAAPEPVPSSTLTITGLLKAYESFLHGANKSVHTIDSFLSDIRRLGMFLHRDRVVTDIDTQDLSDFLSAERARKDVQSDATVYRKHTTLKNFFGWLHLIGIIKNNPAAALPFVRPDSFLPKILSNSEADLFFNASKKTSMEYVVAMLILGAGLKRCELIALTLADIDVSDQLKPVVKINAKHKFKTRDVTPPVEFSQAYKQYIESTLPKAFIDIPGQWSGSPADLNYNDVSVSAAVFSLTPRTLNYLVDDIATRAGLQRADRRITCQILRDTYAVSELLTGTNMDKVFEKLGLALTVCNTPIRIKYRKLAERQVCR